MVTEKTYIVIKQFYELSNSLVGNYTYYEMVKFFKHCIINKALEETNYNVLLAAKLLDTTRRIIEINKE